MKNEIERILVGVFTKYPEKFKHFSEEDKLELQSIALTYQRDFGMLSEKKKHVLLDLIVQSFFKGKISHKEQVEISAPIDLSKPLQKYVEMAKMATNNEPYFQVVGEYKFNRLIGKVMQVVEMLPLEEQKQEATKAVLKDYLYDCMNENNCIRVDIFRELQKDGLPTEEHIYG